MGRQEGRGGEKEGEWMGRKEREGTPRVGLHLMFEILGNTLGVYLVISRFWSCDLDRDPMTLTDELNLVILKMYLGAKMKFLGQHFQTSEHARTGQTDT